MKITITKAGTPYIKFIKTIAGSTNQRDLSLAWKMGISLKHYHKPIILNCPNVEYAESMQNNLRALGAVVIAKP